MYIDLSGRGGLAPRWFGDEGDTTEQHPEFRYLGTNDQNTATYGQSTATDMAAGIWNPSRRYGFMSPANNSFVALNNQTNNAFNHEIVAGCYDPFSQIAFIAEKGSFGVGSNIFQNVSLNINSWTQPVGITWPQAAITQFFDMTMYQINGVPTLFASYGASQSDILTFPPGVGSGAHVNWLTATAAGAFNIGGGDIFFIPSSYYMYVVNQNFVHRIDGTAATGTSAGTALQNVLIAASNVTFNDGVSWNGNVWLVASESINTLSSTYPKNQDSYSSTQVRVYVWDESVTAISNVNYITLSGVKIVQKIYVTRSGKMRLICVSSKRTVQIREYNGVTFDVIEEAGIQSFPNYRRAVQQAGDCIVWTGNDGNIYSHGPVVPGEAEQLNIIGSMIGQFSYPNTFFTGAALFVDNNLSTTTSRTALIVSAYDTNNSTAVNRVWYPNTVGNNANQGNVYTLVKYFPSLVKVNYARVYHHVGAVSIPGSDQGELVLLLNQDTASQGTPLTYPITQDDVARGYKYCPVNQGGRNAVFAIQAVVIWHDTNLTSDATDWLPRLLEIDYTPLEKLM